MPLTRIICLWICITLQPFSTGGHDFVHTIIDKQSISVYPNPLSDSFMFLEAEHQGLVSIFTKAGDRIFSEDYNVGINKYDIDHILPGDYTFKVVSDGSMSIASFDMTRN